LLDIFDFYVDEVLGEDLEEQRIEEWITLAHVCRRWRSIVFQSPRRLNLRLLCTHKKRTMDTLDIWPPLPLIIRCVNCPFGAENKIIAALKHNDRVSQIKLCNFKTYDLRHITYSAMRKPFPELTHLRFQTYDEPGLSVLPDSFLGGSAPRLRSLYLECIEFRGIPKLLLSATHLVDLDLYRIPRFGYDPQAMATSLSTLTNLESLRLHFRTSDLESRRLPPPPLTRSILPSLTKILFDGAREYLEEILARIDAPRLNQLHITFYHQIIFDTPQLFQFIGRTPTLRAPEKGHIALRFCEIIVKFPSQTSDYDVLSVGIPSTALEGQLSFLEQLCTSLPPVSTLEDLYIHEYSYRRPYLRGNVGNTRWLDLLRSFVSVKSLYLSEELVLHIAPALQGLVGERTTEVLPALENILLEGFRPSGPLHEGIEKFVAARCFTDHPVAISRWDPDW
jgi:hypothetical protein